MIFLALVLKISKPFNAQFLTLPSEEFPELDVMYIIKNFDKI